MKYRLSFVTFIRISSDAKRLKIATSGITFISGRILSSSDCTQFSFCCTFISGRILSSSDCTQFSFCCTFISGHILSSSDCTQFSFCCTQSPHYGPPEL